MVRSVFTKEPFRGVNPDEAVAAGAAIQGSILRGGFSDLILLDVVPFSLGIRLEDGSFCHCTRSCFALRSFAVCAK